MRTLLWLGLGAADVIASDWTTKPGSGIPSTPRNSVTRMLPAMMPPETSPSTRRKMLRSNPACAGAERGADAELAGAARDGDRYQCEDARGGQKQSEREDQPERACANQVRKIPPLSPVLE